MIKDMFDAIDRRYDFLNHLFSLSLDYSWRRVMVMELLPLDGKMILDLATGTGDSAIELARKGFLVTGLDLSFNMLSRAVQKISGTNFLPVLGSAYHMPFRDNSFDGVTCAFGIRNMHKTSEALLEIHRILKHGGKAIFLEFSMPTSIIRTPYRFYLRHVIPNIARLFSRREAYQYLGVSIEGFYAPGAFYKIIRDAGFSYCEKLPLSAGLVYLHKAIKT